MGNKCIPCMHKQQKYDHDQIQSQLEKLEDIDRANEEAERMGLIQGQMTFAKERSRSKTKTLFSGSSGSRGGTQLQSRQSMQTISTQYMNSLQPENTMGNNQPGFGENSMMDIYSEATIDYDRKLLLCSDFK